MTIQCFIDKNIFKRFTIFDIIKRRKYWRSPVIFASILVFSAVICYVMHKVDGAVLLGTVLLVIGLGTPLVYFATFFHSVAKQIKELHLSEPTLYYTVELGDKIYVSNQKEKAAYIWQQSYHAYRDDQCIYLYITAQRAFLLPKTGMTEDFEEVWNTIVKKLGDEKSSIIN